MKKICLLALVMVVGCSDSNNDEKGSGGGGGTTSNGGSSGGTASPKSLGPYTSEGVVDGLAENPTFIVITHEAIPGLGDKKGDSFTASPSSTIKFTDFKNGDQVRFVFVIDPETGAYQLTSLVKK